MQYIPPVIATKLSISHFCNSTSHQSLAERHVGSEGHPTHPEIWVFGSCLRVSKLTSWEDIDQGQDEPVAPSQEDSGERESNPQLVGPRLEIIHEGRTCHWRSQHVASNYDGVFSEHMICVHHWCCVRVYGSRLPAAELLQLVMFVFCKFLKSAMIMMREFSLQVYGYNYTVIPDSVLWIMKWNV